MKNFKTDIYKIFSILLIIVLIITALSVFAMYNKKVDEIKKNQKKELSTNIKIINEFVNNIENKVFSISQIYPNNKNILKEFIEANSEDYYSLIVLDKKNSIIDYYGKNKNTTHWDKVNCANKILCKIEKKQIWSKAFLTSDKKNILMAYSLNENKNKYILLIDLKKIFNMISSDFIFDNHGYMIKGENFKKNINIEILPNKKDNKIYREIINKKKAYEFTILKNEHNNKICVAYANVNKINWVLVSAVSMEPLYSNIKQIFFTISIISLLIVFILMLVFIKKITNISNEIEKINKNIIKVANGDYDIECNRIEYEEIVNLEKNFKNMTEKLEKKYLSFKSSLEVLNYIFNNSLEGMVLTKKGVIVDVNKTTMKLFNIKNKKNIIGKTFSNFLTSNTFFETRSEVEKNIDTKVKEYNFVYEGKTYFILGKGKKIIFNEEEFRLSTYVDITELRYNQELLQRQSKNATMGEMIGNISHQLKQPLSVISTCSSGTQLENELGTLENGILNERLELITENVNYMAQTIDDFRDFFNPKNNKFTNFKISEVVNKAISLTRAQFKARNIEIIVNIEDLNINSVKNDLVQVVINILNNARDALVNIKEKKIILLNVLKKNKKIYIEIQDNAGGISNENIEKIFEAYFTTKESEGGTGIGLYMCKQLLSQVLNGRIFVKNKIFTYQNKEYYGACFIVILRIDYIES